MITGAGLVCTVVYNQLTAFLPDHWFFNLTSVGLSALVFGVLCYLFDYGFVKEGPVMFSMLLSRNTYRSRVLVTLLLVSVVINGFRIAATGFFTIGSRHMNSQNLIPDPERVDVAELSGRLRSDDAREVARVEKELAKIRKEIEQVNTNKKAENHFNGATATANMLLIWRRFKQGNEWGRNKVAQYNQSQLERLEPLEAKLAQQVADLTGKSMNFRIDATSQVDSLYLQDLARIRGLEKTVSNGLGYVGLVSIAFVILLVFRNALIGNVDPNDVYAVKNVSVAVEDLRDYQRQMEQDVSERLTDTARQIKEEIVNQMKKEQENAREAKRNGVKAPKAKSGTKRKRKNPGGSFSLKYEAGEWLYNGQPRNLSYIKNLASKWYARILDFEAEAEQAKGQGDNDTWLAKKGKAEDNRKKWETAKALFDEQGVSYQVNDEKLSYA